MQVKHLCLYRNYWANWTIFLNCRSKLRTLTSMFTFFFSHQVSLPHLHLLSLLQGSMAGLPSDDPSHSAPVEKAAVQDCRGVCFTTDFPHRGNIVEFSFSANPERPCPVAIPQSHPSSVSWQAVTQKFQTQWSSTPASWRGEKKKPNPHSYLAKAKRHFSTSRLLIWKIKDLLINWKYIFKTVKIAGWRYCEHQMQYLLLCVSNPVLIYRIKWNNQ